MQCPDIFSYVLNEDEYESTTFVHSVHACLDRHDPACTLRQSSQLRPLCAVIHIFELHHPLKDMIQKAEVVRTNIYTVISPLSLYMCV